MKEWCNRFLFFFSCSYSKKRWYKKREEFRQRRYQIVFLKIFLTNLSDHDSNIYLKKKNSLIDSGVKTSLLSFSLSPEFDSTVAISARVSRQRAWPILSIILLLLALFIFLWAGRPRVLWSWHAPGATRPSGSNWNDRITWRAILYEVIREGKESEGWEEPQTWLPFRGPFFVEEREMDDGWSARFEWSSSLSSKGLLVNVWG